MIDSATLETLGAVGAGTTGVIVWLRVQIKHITERLDKLEKQNRKQHRRMFESIEKLNSRTVRLEERGKK